MTPPKRRKKKHKGGPPRVSYDNVERVTAMTFAGDTLVQIQEATGLSYAAIYEIRKRPEVVQVIAEMRAARRESAEARLEAKASEAIDSLHKIAQGEAGTMPWEQVRERRIASESILDRFGLPKKLQFHGFRAGSSTVPHEGQSPNIASMPSAPTTLFDFVRLVQTGEST